jgi:hypothetical protein
MVRPTLADRLQLEEFIRRSDQSEEQLEEMGGVWWYHTCPVCQQPFIYLRAEKDNVISIVQEGCNHIYFWNNSKNYMFMDAALAAFFSNQGITFRRI